MKKNSIYLFLFIYAAAATLTILFFDGTGDAGDSIHHYLFARYAPLHPRLFFDHWAKPVYVLLASPFAQFGFTGVKVFNALAAFFTLLFTYKTSVELNLKNPLLSAVILLFSPLYYILIFSGLTEPLFALFLIISIYAVLRHKLTAACILVSFLPFVRSDGLIILGVFGIYLLLKKEWKMIPWLLAGHVVYSFAGWFVHGDLLWVFTKIPYARLSSNYGSGNLSHFVVQLIYVVGIPVYILFWMGVIATAWKSIKKQLSLEYGILVFLGFVLFFAAHTLFWYFGIFNSMGLKRVLIGVMPLTAILSLAGFNFIVEEMTGSRKILRLITGGLLTAYLLVFPFTRNPAAINWKKDMMLSQDQQSARKAAAFITRSIGRDHRFIFAHPYLSEALDLDHFDAAKRMNLDRDFLQESRPGDIIVWENWFAVVESKVTREQLDAAPQLERVYLSGDADDGREILYAVYRRR